MIISWTDRLHARKSCTMRTSGSTLSLAGISGLGRVEIASLTARGRRVLSVADVSEALDIDSTSAAKKLARWSDQGWVRRVRRGLYIPVPLEAENPAKWSEDPLVLADAVWAPCYFTGWTAANHWGLTEQIFRTTVLKTTRRVRRAHERLLDYDYTVAHVPDHLMEWGMRAIWLDDRRVQVADRARTVIDILDDPSLGGGIRHGTEVLAAYLGGSDWHPLVEYGDRIGNRTVFKRLGYVVEAAELGTEELVEECRQRVSAGISLLDPGAPPRGRRVSRWGLRINVSVTGLEPS
jgi:predicted transcriptional regulator of viral defense system